MFPAASTQPDTVNLQPAATTNNQTEPGQVAPNKSNKKGAKDNLLGGKGP